jgi:hypothetical protein
MVEALETINKKNGTDLKEGHTGHKLIHIDAL